MPQPSVKVPGPRQGRRRGSALSRVLLWTFLLVLFAGIMAAAAGFYAYSEYGAPGPLAADKVIIVEPGLSVSAIGTALEQNGVISSAPLFTAMAQLTGQRGKLKAGEYEFPKSASMRDVMALIASGKSLTYKVSIPEGFTSEMAVARVNANEVLTGPPAAVPPEGSILPDTYVFRRGMTKQKLVQDMQSAQSKLLAELWAARTPVPVIATPEQAVTLASIVEKETAVAAERPMIASVFINRLEKGMRLQSDPTIIYGIAGGKGRLDRELTRTDINTATPYNTYRINGLPPGPIANPGRAALEAVLNPPQTQHLYFVADGSGGHAFAATLEEHNRNVKTWRKIAGNAAAAAAADAPDEQAAAQAQAASQPPAAEAVEGPLADVSPEPDPLPAADAPAPKVEATPEAPAKEPAAAKPAPLKPGSIVMVDGRPVPVPRLRPAQ